MLDGLAACAHGVWILVEPRLSAFENVFVHPSLDTALWARRALRFEWTGFAGVRPIVAQLLAVFVVDITIFEFLTGRAAINILIWQMIKVLFAEASRSLRTRCHRLGQSHRDARLLARHDFFTLEVAAIGDNIERVGLKNGFGLPG